MFGFKSNKEKLIAHVEELVLLLNLYGVACWSDRLTKNLDYLKNDDASGVAKLLAEFGGMGSLNDLYICSSNGHLVSSSKQEKLANIKLDSLRVKIYKLVKSLERIF